MLEHAAEDREALRVWHERSRRVVSDVAELRVAGPSPREQGLPVAAPHVDGEVVAVLGGHPEHDRHEHLVIAGSRIGALGRDDLLDRALGEGPHDVPTILGVAGEAVELPAENALGLPAREVCEDAGEHRPPWRLRRSRLLAWWSHDREASLGGDLPEFADLRRDRELLPLLGLRRLADVDDVAFCVHRTS